MVHRLGWFSSSFCHNDRLIVVVGNPWDVLDEGIMATGARLVEFSPFVDVVVVVVVLFVIVLLVLLFVVVVIVVFTLGQSHICGTPYWRKTEQTVGSTNPVIPPNCKLPQVTGGCPGN
jgi:hypothetical protein